MNWYAFTPYKQGIIHVESTKRTRKKPKTSDSMASLKFILAAMLIAIFFLGMLHINKEKYSLIQDFQYYFYIIYVDL